MQERREVDGRPPATIGVALARGAPSPPAFDGIGRSQEMGGAPRAGSHGFRGSTWRTNRRR
jgi:hypothetical protein